MSNKSYNKLNKIEFKKINLETFKQSFLVK